jgi:sulfite exporter TauE/SafE
VFRAISAALLIAVGLVLLVPKLQAQFALAASPVGNWVDEQLGGFATSGLWGQFALGLLLGAVWSPCVGPTLGAASILAAKGEDLGQVALTMLAFGIGAALPLMLLGFLSREAMMRWRGRMMEAGKGGKMLFGALLVAIGLRVASGLDKRLETVLVDASPAWLTEAGKGGKMLLGGLLVAIGLFVATGLDKRLETVLVDASPAWLTELTTKF